MRAVPVAVGPREAAGPAGFVSKHGWARSQPSWAAGHDGLSRHVMSRLSTQWSCFIAFENTIPSHRSVIACLEDLREADLVVTYGTAE